MDEDNIVTKPQDPPDLLDLESEAPQRPSTDILRQRQPEFHSFGESTNDGQWIPDLALALPRAVHNTVRDLYSLVDHVGGDSLPDWDRWNATTTAGAVTSDIFQLVAGFGVAGAAVKGVGLASKLNKLGKLGKYSKNILEFGLAGTMFENHTTLSNLLQDQHIGGPLTEFLAVGPDDSDAKARFKAALEGLAIAPIVTPAMRILGKLAKNTAKGAYNTIRNMGEWEITLGKEAVKEATLAEEVFNDLASGKSTVIDVPFTRLDPHQVATVQRGLGIDPDELRAVVHEGEKFYPKVLDPTNDLPATPGIVGDRGYHNEFPFGEDRLLQGETTNVEPFPSQVRSELQKTGKPSETHTFEKVVRGTNVINNPETLDYPNRQALDTPPAPYEGDRRVPGQPSRTLQDERGVELNYPKVIAPEDDPGHLPYIEQVRKDVDAMREHMEKVFQAHQPIDAHLYTKQGWLFPQAANTLDRLRAFIAEKKPDLFRAASTREGVISTAKALEEMYLEAIHGTLADGGNVDDTFGTAWLGLIKNLGMSEAEQSTYMLRLHFDSGGNTTKAMAHIMASHDILGSMSKALLKDLSSVNDFEALLKGDPKKALELIEKVEATVDMARLASGKISPEELATPAKVIPGKPKKPKISTPLTPEQKQNTDFNFGANVPKKLPPIPPAPGYRVERLAGAIKELRANPRKGNLKLWEDRAEALYKWLQWHEVFDPDMVKVGSADRQAKEMGIQIRPNPYLPPPKAPEAPTKPLQASGPSQGAIGPPKSGEPIKAPTASASPTYYIKDSHFKTLQGEAKMGTPTVIAENALGFKAADGKMSEMVIPISPKPGPHYRPVEINPDGTLKIGEVGASGTSITPEDMGTDMYSFPFIPGIWKKASNFLKDMAKEIRDRGTSEELADTFIFTREQMEKYVAGAIGPMARVPKSRFWDMVADVARTSMFLSGKVLIKNFTNNILLGQTIAFETLLGSGADFAIGALTGNKVRMTEATQMAKLGVLAFKNNILSFLDSIRVLGLLDKKSTNRYGGDLAYRALLDTFKGGHSKLFGAESPDKFDFTQQITAYNMQNTIPFKYAIAVMAPVFSPKVKELIAKSTDMAGNVTNLASRLLAGTDKLQKAAMGSAWFYSEKELEAYNMGLRGKKAVDYAIEQTHNVFFKGQEILSKERIAREALESSPDRIDMGGQTPQEFWPENIDTMRRDAQVYASKNYKESDLQRANESMSRAEEATLVRTTGAITNGIKYLVTRIKPLMLLAPVITTSANLAKFSLWHRGLDNVFGPIEMAARGLVGGADKALEQAKGILDQVAPSMKTHAGPNSQKMFSRMAREILSDNPRERVPALGRFQIGIGLITLFTMLSLAQYDEESWVRINGPSPEDPERRKLYEKLHTPNSLEFGPRDKPEISIPLQDLDVVGPLANFISGAVQYSYHSDDKDQPFFDMLLGSALTGTTNFLKEDSYLRNAINFVEAITSKEPKKIQRVGRSIAGMFVPSVMAQAVPLVHGEEGDVLREANDILEHLKRKSGIGYESLDKQYDIIGRPIKRKPALAEDSLGRMMTLFAPNGPWVPGDDPVSAEMNSLQHNWAGVQNILSEGGVTGIDLREIRNEKGQTAKNRLQELVGTLELPDYFDEKRPGTKKSLENTLKSLINSKRYTSLPKFAGEPNLRNYRVSLITDTIGNFRSAAKQEIKKEFPEIRETLEGAKKRGQAAFKNYWDDLLEEK